MNKIEKKYILPNSITIANLFLGYSSIIMSFKEEYSKAAWLIMAAMICDVLDGKTARKFKIVRKSKTKEISTLPYQRTWHL